MRALIVGIFFCFTSSFLQAKINDKIFIPEFEAITLNGKSISSQALRGKPSILIITPSRGAAAETRAWVEALQKNIDLKNTNIRDIIALDLPFFMDTQDAIPIAKKKIPSQYYDQTWMLSKPILENRLGIPVESESAFLLVVNSELKVTLKLQGAPDSSKISQINAAMNNLSQ